MKGVRVWLKADPHLSDPILRVTSRETEPWEERLEWPFKLAARALSTVFKHRSGCGACFFGKAGESCSPRFLVYHKGDSRSRLGAFEKHFCSINLCSHRRLCGQLIVSRRVEVGRWVFQGHLAFIV